MASIYQALQDPAHNIRHINLANNFLDEECYRIVGDILRLQSKLSSLNLANNLVSPEAALSMAAGLKNNTNLQRLYLSHTSLNADGAAAILNAINSEGSLSVLDISHCNIGDDGAREVAALLKRNTAVETLTIYANDIRAVGGKAIFDGLLHNTKLKRLYYGPGNVLPNSAMNLLSDYLVQEHATLKTLDISGTGVQSGGWSLLGEALKKPTISLSELSLKANDLSKGVIAKKFINAISENHILRCVICLLLYTVQFEMIFVFLQKRHVDISACQIDATSSYAIANLITNSSIEILNLGFNRLRSNGGKIVFGALQHTTSLKSLDISGNLLQTKFLSDLDSAEIAPLEVLYIGQNSLGDRGVGSLIRNLKNASSLKELYLDLYNSLSDAGAFYVADFIRTSASPELSFIDISGNKITDNGGHLMLRAAKARVENGLSVVELKLTGNAVSESLLKDFLKFTGSKNATSRTVHKHASEVRNMEEL